MARVGGAQIDTTLPDDANVVNTLPTPHGQALDKLLDNRQLPKSDRKRVLEAKRRYEKWIADMRGLQSEGEERVRDLVRLLNDYKRSVDLDLIWDSEQDFLRRQDGQLKLGSTILEEFLPHLCHPSIVPALSDGNYVIGPRRTLTSIRFSPLTAAPGLESSEKDQDFTICRAAKLQLTLDGEEQECSVINSAIPYFTAEIKTNLDWTMLQGIAATAEQSKAAVPGSRYFVVCEWLDMTPRSTGATALDEGFVLRGKRPSSNERKNWADPKWRREHRDEYARFLNEHPIRGPVSPVVSKSEAILGDAGSEATRSAMQAAISGHTSGLTPVRPFADRKRPGAIAPRC